MSKSTRLAGHELAYEGAPHTVNGTRIYGRGGTAGDGCGKCSCGAVSPFYTSGAQRKAWHKRHKDLIRGEQVIEEMTGRCHSHHAVPVVGVVQCLLAAPHPGYRHYAALLGKPEAFWMWGDAAVGAVYVP